MYAMHIPLFHNKQSTKSRLQVSCIELLHILLEETNENSSKLARGISEDLDVKVLLDTMVQLRVSTSIITCQLLKIANAC